MSNHEDSAPETTDRARKRRRIGLIGAAVAGLVVLGGIGVAGVSAHGDRGGHRWGHRGPVSIESMQERAENKIAWIAGKVDASEEQQRELESIADGLITDLFPLIEQHRERRRALITELTRPEFDRDAIEAIRRQLVADVDSGSARLVEALAQTSDVLTVEQRQTLTSRFMRRMRR